MLELGETELELFEVRTGNQAELLEEAFEARSGSLARPDCFATPAARRLVDQLPRVLAAHPTGLGELVGEGLRALGGQSDRTESREPEALERVED